MSRHTVKITCAELLVSANIGVMRQVENIKRKFGQAYGIHDDKSWDADITGAVAEYAIAKTMNKHWRPVKRDRDTGDVQSIEVRSTTYKTGCLILHNEDLEEKPNSKYYLVITDFRKLTCEIVGWTTPKESCQPEFWKDPKGGRPAYFVPQSALHQFEQSEAA